MGAAPRLHLWRRHAAAGGGDGHARLSQGEDRNAGEHEVQPRLLDERGPLVLLVLPGVWRRWQCRRGRHDGRMRCPRRTGRAGRWGVKYSERAYLEYDPFSGDRDVTIEFRHISMVTT